MKKPNKHNRILMICPNSEVERDVNEFFARCGGVLRLVEQFAAAAVEIDETAADFQDKVASPLEKFFVGIIELYPNPAQLEGDIEILRNSLFAQIRNKKGGH